MPIWSKLFGFNKPRHTDDEPELIQNNIACGKAVMLDVRSNEEWSARRLKNAIHIPITELKSLATDSVQVPQLDRSLIVYCH